MATTTDILKKRFIKAMEATLGNVAQSAKLTGVHRSTYYDWIKADSKFKEIIEGLNEDIGDIVESQLKKKIMGYSVIEDKVFQYKGKPVIIPTTIHYQPELGAIIFFCKTKLKTRGYIESVININKSEEDEMENWTDEQLAHFANTGKKPKPEDLKKDAGE